MKRGSEWLPVAGWGLAVAGAFVVYVSGGCKLIWKAQDGMERVRARRDATRHPVDPGPEVTPPGATSTPPPAPVPNVVPSTVPVPHTP